MDAWTWTLQYLAVSTAKWKPILVPPCPELPRTVHESRPEVVQGSNKSEVAMVRKATRNSHENPFTPNRTTDKYLARLIALKAENPTWTQKQLGDAVGIAQSAVSIIMKQGQHAAT